MTTQPEAPAAPETILCDTSFVSVAQSADQRASHPETVKVWPASTVSRLNGAILAISVITLAELRDGHIYANWGAARRARAEVIIGSYLLVPLDMAIWRSSIAAQACGRPAAMPASACPTTTSGSPRPRSRAAGPSSRVTRTSTPSPTSTT